MPIEQTTRSDSVLQGLARYNASFPRNPEQFTAAQMDLVRRRTQPFLKNGTHYSIEHLLQEAYLQGLRDASEAMQ